MTSVFAKSSKNEKQKVWRGVGAYYGTGEPEAIAGGESSPGTSLYA